MSSVRLRRADQRSAPFIPSPDRTRITAERLRSSKIFGPIVLPESAGAAKCRNSAFRGDPCSSQYANSPRRMDGDPLNDILDRIVHGVNGAGGGEIGREFYLGSS